MTSQDAANLLQVGKLVDMQWSLGMAIASSTCKNLRAPFITIAIKVKNSAGQNLSRSFELSLAEFQTFSGHIKDIATVMETM